MSYQFNCGLSKKNRKYFKQSINKANGLMFYGKWNKANGISVLDLAPDMKAYTGLEIYSHEFLT